MLAELNVNDKEYVKLSGDVNKDGLDIKDATKIQKYIAEIKTPYPIGEPVGASAIGNIVVSTKAEGIAKYMTVDRWAVDTSDGGYWYVTSEGSIRYKDAGKVFNEEGYIKSHIEYVDENGKPDASKVTVFFDEKPNPNVTLTNVWVCDAVRGPSAKTIWADKEKLATAWQNGKYTFDLPKVEETTLTAKVTWQGAYNDYSVSIYKDGTVVDTKSVSGTECTFGGLSAGSYEARVSANGYEQTKAFTVGAEVVSNNDGHDFKLVQTKNVRAYFCSRCGCCIDGNVSDHLITESDWQRVKAEAATYEQTSEGSYYNYPRYHKQYFIKDMVNQEFVESKYYWNKDGKWSIYLKPGEEPIDSATEKPYLIGKINEEEKLMYGGECGLILIPSKTDISKLMQDAIAANPVYGKKVVVGKIDPDKGTYFKDETGEWVLNAKYETVPADWFTEDYLLNMSYVKYHVK